jgi:hypothetical protein
MTETFTVLVQAATLVASDDSIFLAGANFARRPARPRERHNSLLRRNLVCQAGPIWRPRQDSSASKHAQQYLSSMSARQLSPTTQPQAADMRAAGRRIVSITAATDLVTKSPRIHGEHASGWAALAD